MTNMLVSLLSNLIGVALLLATLPLVGELFVLSMASLLPRSRKAVDGQAGAPLTVVVPAHNEESLVGRCVRSIRAAAGSGVEVLVVAHNCTDATAMTAREAGAEVLILDDPARAGKGYALNHGFAAALERSSQGVLVIDADSVIDPGLVEEVRRRLAAGAPAVQSRYELTASPEHPRTKLTALAFHAFNTIRPRGRSRLGLSAGILGNGFALHRETLTRIPYGAHSIVEDLEYHLTLVLAGVRVEFIDTAAVRAEAPVSSGSARTQRARWEGGRLLVMRQWVPRLLLRMIRGEMQLIEPLFDLLGLPIAPGVICLLFAALLPVLWLRLYALAASGVVVLHVTLAALSGPGLRETMAGLMCVPGYILWKIRIFPAIWRASRAGAAWVRTEREARVDAALD